MAARAGEHDHIGASGLVFGFAAYLVARGVFSRRPLHLVVGLVVLAVYGTTLLFGLVPTPGVSWQGHLFGAVGGVVAARVLHAATVGHLQQLRDRVPVAVGGGDAELRLAQLLGELRAPHPVLVGDVDLAAAEAIRSSPKSASSSLLDGLGVGLAGEERHVEVLRTSGYRERVRLDRRGELVAGAHHHLRVDAEPLLDLLLELALERRGAARLVKTTLPLCTASARPCSRGPRAARAARAS